MAEARRTQVFCSALAPSPRQSLDSANPEQLDAWECLPRANGGGRARPPGAVSVRYREKELCGQVRAIAQDFRSTSKSPRSPCVHSDTLSGVWGWFGASQMALTTEPSQRASHGQGPMAQTWETLRPHHPLHPHVPHV